MGYQYRDKYLNMVLANQLYKFWLELEMGKIFMMLQILISDMRVPRCWVLTELHRVFPLQKTEHVKLSEMHSQ